MSKDVLDMGCCRRGWPASGDIAPALCGGAMAGVGLMLMLGCDVYDPDLLQKSEALPVRTDAGLETPSACSQKVELCNAQDDDCDTRIDEQSENDCRFDHSTAVCVGGSCVIVECEGGYADCNRERTDGCEQRASDIACNTCGKVCPGTGRPNGGSTSTGGDNEGGDEDAGADASTDGSSGTGGETAPDASVCMPSPERCDDINNDCDDATDEGPVCAIAMCAASTPTYRGAACDECACTSCSALVALCQNHPDAAWAERCRKLVECVVENTRAGECPNGDCYIGGTGPCAAETHIASGGRDGDDTSQVLTGCVAAETPSTACAAAINYRDRCTMQTCNRACGQ
jgi:hypothetical protein